MDDFDKMFDTFINWYNMESHWSDLDDETQELASIYYSTQSIPAIKLENINIVKKLIKEEYEIRRTQLYKQLR